MIMPIIKGTSLVLSTRQGKTNCLMVNLLLDKQLLIKQLVEKVCKSLENVQNHNGNNSRNTFSDRVSPAKGRRRKEVTPNKSNLL
jgi:hypothetical protein